MSDKADKKFPVMEMFGPTIQGEGILAGARTYFIRFGLCDYRCTLCDSLHAVLPESVKENAEWLTTQEIFKKFQDCIDPENYSSYVTFSGGNPCIHDLTDLVRMIKGMQLLGNNYKVAVETQGTKSPQWLANCDVITVSPKCPSIGEKFEPNKFDSFLYAWQHHKGLNIKIVVFNAFDLEFSKDIINMARDYVEDDQIYLSLGNYNPPGQDIDIVDDDDLRLKLCKSYATMSEDILQDNFFENIKFLPQLHVLGWGNKKGV